MARLARFGADQALAVDFSIEQQYQGLFPPKHGFKPNSSLTTELQDQRDIRAMATLRERATLIGFRMPLTTEDVVGYRTLVERAEHEHRMGR